MVKQLTEEQRLRKNAYMRERKRRMKRENPEALRKEAREWARKNRAEKPEQQAKANKRYVARYPEKVRERQRAWHLRNPGYAVQKNQEYRTRRPNVFLWRSARNRAKADDILFTLAISDIVVPEFCPVLGIKLVPGGGNYCKDACPSVDRIIPEKGYVPGNVVVISFRANALKRNATPEELRRVADYAERETARALKGG